MKQYKDESLKQFIENTQNCRRKALLDGIGGSYERRDRLCCDLYSTGSFSTRLDILQPGEQTRKKRRHIVHTISKIKMKILRDKLIEERKKILAERPGFGFLGLDSICPDVTIDELCKQSRYISSVNDMQLFGIKPEFKSRFFDIVKTVVEPENPPQLSRPKRRRR